MMVQQLATWADPEIADVEYKVFVGGSVLHVLAQPYALGLDLADWGRAGKTFGVVVHCEVVGLVDVGMGGVEGSVQIDIEVVTEVSSFIAAVAYFCSNWWRA